MKVLISAFACSPTGGSEGAVGWNCVIALSSRHEIWVLTNKSGEADVAKARAQGKVPANVKFKFVGHNKPCHPNRLIARCENWLRYLQWNREVLPIARDLASKIDFDLVHHVTYSTWRVGSPLRFLHLPFVWGPVGGGEQFPKHFYSVLSPA